MWRKLLVYAIKAAVASGLPKKGIEWLKGKLVKHVVNLDARITKDVIKVEDVAGPLPEPEVSCDCPSCKLEG